MSPEQQLTELIAAGEVCLLTGAGISTESGIPDYRGPSGRLRAQLPMTIQEFRGSLQSRRRYWARSHLGWRRMAAARPNAGHLAVAGLQRAGVLTGIITQNVDGLHQAAGATGVIDLHGCLDRVVCLGCGAQSSRTRLDARLREVNPEPTPSGRRSANPTAMSRSTMPRWRASRWSTASSAAPTCSSPTSSSSARTSRARAWSGASRCWSGRPRWSCSARR